MPRAYLYCGLLLAASGAAQASATAPATYSTPATRLVTLETPVEEARVTSPFGWRLHPILKRRRFHKGVDFGAPEGTPVLAAEDGVVEAIGRHGHYGLYLRIRHGATVETAYAHLASFTPGLVAGSPVHRGQVIAAVGHTGWATGPHLYYEVIVDGRRVDPDRPGLRLPVDVPSEASEPQLGAAQVQIGGVP